MHRTSVRAAVLAAILAIAALATLPGRALAQDATPGQPSAVDATQAAPWGLLDAAWNARDATRFSDLFTEGASFAFVDRGQVFAGRASLQRHFAEQFPRFPPGLRHVTRVLDTRPVAPGVAAVDGRVEILDVGTDGSAEPKLLRRFSIFALTVLEDDAWRIDLMRIHQLTDDAAQD